MESTLFRRRTRRFNRLADITHEHKLQRQVWRHPTCVLCIHLLAWQCVLRHHAAETGDASNLVPSWTLRSPLSLLCHARTKRGEMLGCNWPLRHYLPRLLCSSLIQGQRRKKSDAVKQPWRAGQCRWADNALEAIGSHVLPHFSLKFTWMLEYCSDQQIIFLSLWSFSSLYPWELFYLLS